MQTFEYINMWAVPGQVAGTPISLCILFFSSAGYVGSTGKESIVQSIVYCRSVTCLGANAPARFAVCAVTLGQAGIRRKAIHRLVWEGGKHDIADF